MTKKSMTGLALALCASAAFGQTGAMVAAVHAKKPKPAPAVSAQSAGQAKILRGEILRDKNDLHAKRKAALVERAELQNQEKAELAKVKSAPGTKAEKSAARKTVREKYARMFSDARQKAAYQRKNLREDIVLKKAQIQKLRRS